MGSELAKSFDLDASAVAGVRVLIPTGYGLNCEAETAAALSEMGVKAPDCIAKLGTLLSLLYRVGCCAWGCRGCDHAVEYIIGRTVTSALSAVRLMRFGYYDEALGLVRNVAEIANLVYLFDATPSALTLWQSLNPAERRRRFSPVEVRRMLEATRGGPLFDHDHYSLLCEVGSHVHPGTRPEAHNLRNRPILGAVLQPAGLLVALNELAAAVAAVAGSGVRLCGLPKEIEGDVIRAMQAVFNATGGVGLRSMQQHWQTMRAADAAVRRDGQR